MAFLCVRVLRFCQHQKRILISAFFITPETNCVVSVLLRDTKRRRRDENESPTTAAHRRDGRGDVLSSLSRGVRRHPLARVSIRRRRGATDTDVPTPARARWIASRPIGRRGRDGVQKIRPVPARRHRSDRELEETDRFAALSPPLAKERTASVP